MVKQLITLLLISILAVHINTAAPEVEDDVLVLTDENFDETIAANQYILVEFYAPWCGHCKKLTPEYAGAASVLKADGIPLAKLDATVHKAAAEKFKIQGFPTLKFFVNGKDSEYNGGRTKGDIITWMKKKTGPASSELKTVADVENFQKTADAVVVLLGSEGLAQYTDLTRAYDDLSFGHCSSQECLSHYNAEDGTVVVFKNFDEKRNDLPKGYNVTTFKEFVEGKTKPVIMKFDEKAAQYIFGKSAPGLFLYYDRNSENASALEAILAEVAPQLTGTIQVIKTGITEGLETRLAEYIGVTAADLPSVRIADTRTDLKKYNMPGAISAENILKFVNDWKNKKLSASLKTEEVPAKQEGPVYVLVGKSFDEIVMDPTKDVLVEFYAPWCGHCKKIAPIYDEVAQKLSHNKNLIIAKMDSTANETDKVSIQGFPTIKFWPAGNKERPMDFEGERTVEGFIDYLTKHSTNALIPKDDL
jgi:protein disulfide-isomerase A1